MNPSLEDLKHWLTSYGLKAGGSWKERADRLLEVRGMIAEEVPARLRAKDFPGPAMPTSR